MTALAQLPFEQAGPLQAAPRLRALAARGPIHEIRDRFRAWTRAAADVRDQFDITRRAVSHLTFGHGPRYCIGAPLARIELQAVFSQLTQRFPVMRLAVPAGELSLNTGVLTGGLTRLPVTW